MHAHKDVRTGTPEVGPVRQLIAPPARDQMDLQRSNCVTEKAAGSATCIGGHNSESADGDPQVQAAAAAAAEECVCGMRVARGTCNVKCRDHPPKRVAPQI